MRAPKRGGLYTVEDHHFAVGDGVGPGGGGLRHGGRITAIPAGRQQTHGAGVADHHHRVGRQVLLREERTVRVGGCTVRVKLALLDGEVINAMPEWEDVAAAAAVLGRPTKQVLQEASAAAAALR